ncbi:MAG: hypothetical protein FWE65_02865 [Eggerthellaceae bacterium]|nr:hypothetical protein [Eggerthellaceae bacterium]
MEKNLKHALAVFFCGALVLFGITVLVDGPPEVLGFLTDDARSNSLKAIYDNPVYRDDSDRLPEGFTQEIFSLTSFHDIRLSKAGGVVGLLSDEPLERVFSFCELELLRRGWIKVDSGHEACASFIKTQGRYSWLYLSCAEIGNGTSVLISFT